MDNHCAVCGEYLADTSRIVCERCEDNCIRERIRRLEREFRRDKPTEGRWIKSKFPFSGISCYRCSECHTTWVTRTNYCPHCGKPMI